MNWEQIYQDYLWHLTLEDTYITFMEYLENTNW
jgi:hypothetical protein